ncbi:hypothetical protein FALBO_5753 [Fusarium albosuccineum]|uniref:Uncharacterized protein n=1 Tax=Fusarium albosuccineum TaxID=1237068 RepID=A0A8H4LFI0_9HYPO|nr:hypothetical protein FALBO_5753 [Fusarium albosuccineum]
MGQHVQTKQPKPFWHHIDLGYMNESTLGLKYGKKYPPVLKSCHHKEKIDSIAAHNSADKWIEIECTKAPADDSHSAFLTWLVGDTGKKLVAWIWMKPERSAAEIKFVIVDEDQVFDQALLEKLSTDKISPEELGLTGEFYWEFEENGEKRHVGVVADFERPYLESKETLSKRWHGYAPKAWIHIRDPQVYQSNLESTVPDPDSEDPQPIGFYKISASWGQVKGNPVHESMTLAALIKAGCISHGTSYSDVVGSMPWVSQPDTFEFFRGVIWNDDPACYLFNDKPNNNGNYAMGVDWYGDYLMKWKLLSDNIIYRSHFGDLQFLHAMGTHKGQSPADTKKMIMLWLEVMYKLAVGDRVSPEDPINRHLKNLFTEDTKPAGSRSLRTLLMGSTPSYSNPIIANRALGSCFHVIQDSYALGHCQRHLTNSEDQIDVTLGRSLWGKVKDWWPWGEKDPPIIIKGFPNGRPGRFTHIENFHCYEGQSEDHHGHYDDIPNGESLDPSNVGSFDCIVGAADAIDKCTRLAEFWKNKTRWDDGVRKFLDEDVFLVMDATDSDTNVDAHLKR